MDVDPGNIKIKTWDKNEVTIDAHGLFQKEVERLHLSQDASTVKVIFNGKNNRYSDVDFEIYIPENFNLDIKTTGGNTELQTELTGDVRIESGGGNVELAEITGDVTLSTGGGNITTEIIYGNLELETGGGNCTIGDVTRDVSVITGGGNLSVGKVAGKVTLETGGGNIDLRGGSDIVSVESGGGNIDLEGLVGAAKVQTGGGTVCVEINPGAEKNSTIESGCGDITLIIPEDAKANIEARLLGAGDWKQDGIRSDFTSAHYDENDDGDVSAMYVLNGGGKNISLRTSAGVIEIRKKKKQFFSSKKRTRTSAKLVRVFFV